MPFVQRNWKGEITGLYAVAQPGNAEEELTEDHPDVAAFRAAHPIPEIEPVTPLDIQRMQQDHARITKEHTALREAIWSFNMAFNEWEVALSALLYEALHLPTSQVAYAIYYSPNGFDARTEIIDNVVKQLVLENKALDDLEPLWNSLYADFRGPRKVRNQIAHGMPITLAINGRNHAKLTAPAFDQNRVGRHIAKTGQPPGLSSKDIRQCAKKVRWLCERVDDVNRLLATFHEDGNPTLSEKFAALESGLRTKDSH